jgi:predicted GNAT family acetyltransferase
MRLDRYDGVTEFLSAAGRFLGAREAEHNLLLGIADSAHRGADLFAGPPYLAVVRDDADVVAAALRTPPYNLVLSEVDDPRAVDVLVDDLGGTPLPGVVGPPAAVRALAERWVERHGGRWVVRMEERIYGLERVLPPPRSATGRLREAAASDEALLESWLGAFAREAMPADAPHIQRTLEEWRRNSRRFWLWEDDGEPVSLAAAGAQTPNGVRIGPVYTPPARRGRGYASALTAGVSALLLAEGRRFCFLYTDLANPTANRIYQQIGYQPVTDALMVAFEP